jgi:hypothetical protein
LGRINEEVEAQHMSTRTATATASAPRRRWFTDAVIAGFVAIGTSTGVLMLGYVLANGLADSQGDLVRRWFWQLTHNEVVAFSSGRPAVAIALHVVLGILWAILYAWLAEPRLSGPGWRRGLVFSLIPWLFSLLILLPAAVVNMLDWAFSAGPLVPFGNLILHAIYGFTLGQLYDSSADAPAIAEDVVYNEQLSRAAVEHSEDFGAAGILLGAIIGAAVGSGLAVVLPPVVPNVDFGGWSIALAVGGVLAGGAVGGIVGSFAGLPQTPDEASRLEMGPDPFEHNVLPFLIPPFLVLVIAGIIVTLGTGLLRLGKSEIEIGPIVVAQAVIAALVGIVVIGLGALWLSQHGDHSSPSSRETVSHRAEH